MLDTFKRAFAKFQADEMTDSAAAMTYYVMMSLFPALLVCVALLGLLGDQSLVTDAVRYAREHGAPAEVTDALDASLSATVENAGGAVSTALVLGVLVAIYGASGAFGGAGRALNTVYGVRETRGFVKHKLVGHRVDARRDDARDRLARLRLPRRRARGGHLRRHRPRRHGGRHLGHRALVRRDRGRAAHVRDHVLVRARTSRRGACAGSRRARSPAS